MAEAREDYTHIAWIDLETTGSNENTDNIIEVGLMITEATPELGIIEQRSWTVTPQEQGKLLRMDPVVIDMHTKSGLLADVLKQIASNRGPFIATVDDEVAKTLTPYLTKGRIALAGSGTSHFDSKFIRRFMPQTAKLLTYWSYDVGSVRRYLRLAGVPIESPSEGLTHRALQDVRDHAAEARKYLAMMKSLSSTVWHAPIYGAGVAPLEKFYRGSNA